MLCYDAFPGDMNGIPSPAEAENGEDFEDYDDDYGDEDFDPNFIDDRDEDMDFKPSRNFHKLWCNT